MRSMAQFYQTLWLTHGKITASQEPCPPQGGLFMQRVMRSTVVVGILFAVACSASAVPGATEPLADAAPSPVLLPTPDIESTVKARVQATVAALPTPTTDVILKAMVRERLIEALSGEYRVFLYGQVPGFGQVYSQLRKAVEGRDWEYVAVYVASECLAERELTKEGFRLFLSRTFSLYASGEAPIVSTALSVTQEMNREAQRQSEGSSPVAKPCMRPYMYPDTVEEAQLAVNLVRVPTSESIAPRLRDGFLNQSNDLAYSRPARNRDLPFIVRLCRSGWCE